MQLNSPKQGNIEVQIQRVEQESDIDNNINLNL